MKVRCHRTTPQRCSTSPSRLEKLVGDLLPAAEQMRAQFQVTPLRFERCVELVFALSYSCGDLDTHRKSELHLADRGKHHSREQQRCTHPHQAQPEDAGIADPCDETDERRNGKNYPHGADGFPPASLVHLTRHGVTPQSPGGPSVQGTPEFDMATPPQPGW